RYSMQRRERGRQLGCLSRCWLQRTPPNAFAATERALHEQRMEREEDVRLCCGRPAQARLPAECNLSRCLDHCPGKPRLRSAVLSACCCRGNALFFRRLLKGPRPPRVLRQTLTSLAGTTVDGAATPTRIRYRMRPA